MNLAALPDTTTGAITSAGLAVGIALLAAEHIQWWRGGGGAAAAGGGPGGAAKDPKQLIPFWFGIAFGTLAVACPAGMLGTGAGIFQWGGNGVGGFVMDLMTGQKANTVATASVPALDGNGALVVTVLVFVLIAMRKKIAKVAKGRFWKGVLAGTLLAIGTGTFAMIGDVVVPGANELGAWALGAIVNRPIL